MLAFLWVFLVKNDTFFCLFVCCCFFLAKMILLNPQMLNFNTKLFPKVSKTWYKQENAILRILTLFLFYILIEAAT